MFLNVSIFWPKIQLNNKKIWTFLFLKWNRGQPQIQNYKGKGFAKHTKHIIVDPRTHNVLGGSSWLHAQEPLSEKDDCVGGVYIAGNLKFARNWHHSSSFHLWSESPKVPWLRNTSNILTSNNYSTKHAHQTADITAFSHKQSPLPIPLMLAVAIGEQGPAEKRHHSLQGCSPALWIFLRALR